MNDPWRFIAFPAAAVIGYALSLGVSSHFSAITGLGDFASKIAVIAIAGFFAGFMVDEVLPAYLEHVRENRDGFGGSSGGDFGGDSGGGFDDEDLDFE